MSKKINLNIQQGNDNYALELEGNIGDVESDLINKLFETANLKFTSLQGERILESGVTSIKEMGGIEKAPPEDEKKAELATLQDKGTLTSGFASFKGVGGIAKRESKDETEVELAHNEDLRKLKTHFDNRDDVPDGVNLSSTNKPSNQRLDKPKLCRVHTEEEVAEKKQVEDTPEHWITGIINTTDEKGDPLKLFKCRYWCSVCGSSKNRYIVIDSRTVFCPECDNEIFVEVATFGTNGEYDGVPIPERDNYGNFFVAREDAKRCTK